MADLYTSWEQGLPKMNELVPISQALLPHDLATAFDLHAVCDVDGSGRKKEDGNGRGGRRGGDPSTSPNVQKRTKEDETRNDAGKRPLSCGQHNDGEGSGEELSARNLKRPRLVWTPRLHKRFVEAVEKVGVDKAVPKTVMQMMGVSGLTRDNVASHLQKYRLLLKKQATDGQTDHHSGIPEARLPTDGDDEKAPVDSPAVVEDKGSW